MRASRTDVLAGSVQHEAERWQFRQAVGVRFEQPDRSRPADGCAQRDAESGSGCRPEPAKAWADKGNTPGKALPIEMLTGDGAQLARRLQYGKRQRLAAISAPSGSSLRRTTPACSAMIGLAMIGVRSYIPTFQLSGAEAASEKMAECKT